MRALVITATLLTGGLLLIGGIMLATAGHPLVAILGIVTSATGLGYTTTGLRADRAIRRHEGS